MVDSLFDRLHLLTKMLTSDRTFNSWEAAEVMGMPTYEVDIIPHTWTGFNVNPRRKHFGTINPVAALITVWQNWYSLKCLYFCTGHQSYVHLIKNQWIQHDNFRDRCSMHCGAIFNPSLIFTSALITCCSASVLCPGEIMTSLMCLSVCDVFTAAVNLSFILAHCLFSLGWTDYN